MPIKVIEHDKPKMPKIHMMCDEPIDEKLTQQGEAVNCCFSKTNFTIFAGGCGSGKTTTLLALLKGALRKTHEHVYVVMPEVSMSSISEKDNVFSKYLPTENIYHDFNADILKEIYAKITENAKQGEYSMLIIDDYGDMLHEPDCMKLLEKFAIKHRHIKLGFMAILTQNYYQMPKKLRELATNCFLWNSNKSQNEKFFKEQFQFSREIFEEIIQHCPTSHDWILLNLKYKRIFNKDWNEILPS